MSDCAMALRTLLESMLVAHDAAALWVAVARACSTAAGTDSTEVYAYSHSTRELRSVQPQPDQTLEAAREARYTFGPPMSTRGGFAVAKAARQGRVVEYRGPQDTLKIAVPLYGHPDWNTPPLGVVALRLHTDARGDEHLAALNELVPQLWPVTTLAALRYPFASNGQTQNIESSLASVVDTLCDTFGFEFATVSLIDEDQHLIRTRAGREAPWISDAWHSLDSEDIQAKLIRDRTTRIITGWHPDLDRAIFERYGHKDLIRIFIPIVGSLQPLGTIEAGYRRQNHSSIHPLLQATLEGWTGAEVARSIESALLLERQHRYALGLTTLHELSYELQTDVKLRPPATWMRNIVEAGRTVLQADLVLLYLWDADALRFLPPVHAGALKGRSPLVSPDEPGNIVDAIMSGGALYVPEVTESQLLVHPDQTTFTERQRIRSFAGVPLVVHGETLGVLCVNYHQRRQFGERERRTIELYARQAAALIAGDRFARRRMEFDLHDLVKTKLSAIKGQATAALLDLESNGFEGAAIDRLQDVQNYCNELLANISTILDDLAITTPGANVLRGILERSLERLARLSGPPVVRVEVGESLPEVPLVCAAELSYFIDQAVNNARQHAHANTIDVRVHCTGDALHVEVEDDGRGFELPHLPISLGGEVAGMSTELAARGYRGLASMTYRAEGLAGSLRFNSAPGLGSKVRLVIPVTQETDESM